MSNKPQLTEEQKRELWLDRAVLARKNPWYWTKYFTYTKDERDKTEVANKKLFPALAMYRVICRVWQESDVLFVEKSRQIRMTWIVSNLFLWDAMFHKARRIADQSKKQEDADGILERQRHIYKNALEFAGLFEATGGWPVAKMTGEKVGTSERLEFPDMGSLIVSIPQGGEILASHTWSGCLADEINLQPEAEKGHAAAMPCVDKWIGQGTPYGRRYAYYMMHNRDQRTNKVIGKSTHDSDAIIEKTLVPPDDLPIDPEYPQESARRWLERQLVEMPDKEFNALPLEELIACVPGMRYWKNSKGHACLRVHYTADPEKDPATRAGAEWYSIERPKYSQGYWEQHYEISYEAFEGRPVISNWARHIFVKKLTYDSNLPIRLSMDFGTEICGAMVAQYAPIEGFNAYQLRVINEIILRGSNTPALLNAVILMLQTYYPRSWRNNNILAYCDPAGNQGRETNADSSQNTSIKILEAGGIYPRSKKFGVSETTQLLETVFALVLPNGEPAIVLDERCTHFIGCFSGGLHYPIDAGGKPGHYEKDGEWDHDGDMARYMIGNCFDQYALSGKTKATVKQQQVIRRKYTAEIIGRRPSNRVNPQRGTHAIRD